MKKALMSGCGLAILMIFSISASAVILNGITLDANSGILTNQWLPMSAGAVCPHCLKIEDYRGGDTIHIYPAPGIGIVKTNSNDGKIFYSQNNGETGARTMPGIPLLLLDTEPFALVSSSFANGEPIPVQYSLLGGNNSPPLSWSNAPANTNSFVLIMDDPDAPVDTWDHWIIYDIPAETTSLAENAGAFGDGGLPSGAAHGTNSWLNNYYQGPSPPSGTHRYYFKLYALSVSQLNPSGTKKAAIEAAMAGKIMGQTELMGTYTYSP